MIPDLRNPYIDEKKQRGDPRLTWTVIHVQENRVAIDDLHTTLLHQLGMDHTKLTYRYAGRDFRLTDVYGDVVKDVLA
jgi:hypothetical protein